MVISSIVPASLDIESLLLLGGMALSIIALIVAVLFGRPSAEDEAPEETNGAIFGSWTPVLAGMIPDVFPSKAQRDLLRCGYYHPAAYDSYLALRNCLVVGVVFSTVCWLVAVADQKTLIIPVLITGIVAAILAYALPRVYLSWRGDRRADRIVLGFPDALDIIVMGLTGGLPLQTALERTAEEIRFSHPDLSAELKLVCRQASTLSLEYALNRMAERVDSDDITTLTSTATHAEQMGAPITAVLRDGADNFRRTRMQRIQERGNKISLKMLFPVVLCLMPATYVVVLAPPLLNLKNFRDRSRQEGGVLNRPDLAKLSTAERMELRRKAALGPQQLSPAVTANPQPGRRSLSSNANPVSKNPISKNHKSKP